MSWWDVGHGSSAECDRLIAPVDLHRSHRLGDTEGAVRSVLIEKVEEIFRVGVGLDLRLVALQVNLVIFDGAPEPLDKDFVEAKALAVQWELYAQSKQQLGKLGGGELAALIGVEDLRRAVLPDRSLQGPHAKGRVERIRVLPGQNRSVEPADHGEQIDQVDLDRDIRDVGGPNLIRALDLEMARHPVLRVAARRIGLLINRI